MSSIETTSTEAPPARILVVEDEVIVAKDIERTLVAIGYDVVGRVARGEDAIEQARACKPDLVLMDIHLGGGVDGIDAANTIREELRAPVIFLTAFSDGDTINRAQTTAPFAYILKPFKELELRCAIEIALNKSRTDALLRQLNASLEARTVELAAANQELEGFAYAVAHDLRAPLRAMSGFGQAMMEELGETLTGEMRADLNQIIVASHHMGELIDGLLTLSRCTRGDLRRDRIDLSALGGRLLRRLTAAEPGRTVEWTVHPGLTAQGDARMIEAVMANLLENAWKFTAHTAAPAIRVYAEREGSDLGEVVFCVADNGAGFDMRHAERLFKPFQRLHRQDEFQGIGIGLATVQRIVRRHGGTIRATAAVGQGATFRFSLPSAEEWKTS